MRTLTTYEHPLNERMRLFMRLESMFQQMRQFQNSDSSYEVQLYFDALFDVLDFLHRYEVRSELIKELQYYKQLLNKQPDNFHPTPYSEDTLAQDIEQHLQEAHHINFNRISVLRENQLFNNLRQRNFHKSGSCLFEVPAYQYWLSRHRELSGGFLNECYARVAGVDRCIMLILHLIRTGTRQITIHSDNATFVKTLDGCANKQLVRVHILPGYQVFPRVSGDKHRVAICFMQQDDPMARAYQIAQPIDFGLQICNE